ncbi:MAG: response regulator [Planctomycetota bacterium]
MGLRVLIVDDSSLIRSVLAKSLRLSGLDLEEICEAADGKQAWELLQRDELDLVFSDLHMPEMDGVQLIHNLAEAGRLQRTPVIVISSDRSRERREELLSLGVRAFLRKPFTPDSVRAEVTQVLEVCR